MLLNILLPLYHRHFLFMCHKIKQLLLSESLYSAILCNVGEIQSWFDVNSYQRQETSCVILFLLKNQQVKIYLLRSYFLLSFCVICPDFNDTFETLCCKDFAWIATKCLKSFENDDNFCRLNISQVDFVKHLHYSLGLLSSIFRLLFLDYYPPPPAK